MWRFRGTPFYLEKHSKRLGIAPILAKRAQHNPEIYRISVLLGQLCERYHKARKEHGKPVLGRLELNQVAGTLDQAEQLCQSLHMLAAAAAEIIDEAHSAFGTEPTRGRVFEIMCNLDPHTPPLPLGDGTVGAPDRELEPALAEGG
jgi:hypothetical protein